MEYSALHLVLKDERFPPTFLQDFVLLMQKFEVVLLLDKERLLIPSLLPDNEKNACVVFPLSVSLTPDTLSCIDNLGSQPFARISTLDMKVFARYYLLPFVPNGFFPRLIARIVGSKITSCFSNCVPTSESFHNVYNGLHWRPWRNGIVLVHRHMEMVRVSPISLPHLGKGQVYLTSSKGQQCHKEPPRGIEIMVAILPDGLVTGDSEHLLSDDDNNRSHQLGVWLLRQLTEITDSVFEDWYEGFARRKGFDFSTIHQASPCPLCLSGVFRASRNKKPAPRKSVSASSTPNTRVAKTLSSSSYSDFVEFNNKDISLYLFSSPFCVLSSSTDTHMKCNDHGPIPVSCVAPDLVSC